jgi:rubrerythrin
MADVHTLLRPLERLETLMAEIYESLASTHKADVEASRLFSRLAMDERSHASQVSYVRRLASQNPKDFTSVAIDLPEALKTLEDVTTLRCNVENLTLPEVVKMLHCIEQQAAEAHARKELAQASQSLSHLLINLMQADRSHAQAIREFASRRGFLAS